MRRSLSIKLSLAAALVAFFASALTAVGVQQAIERSFVQFISSTITARANQLIPLLAGYYAEHGTWTGVESTLFRIRPTPQGAPGNRTLRILIGNRFVLAGADAKVVAGSEGVVIGVPLSAAQLKRALPVQLAGQTVGLLVVEEPTRPFTGLEARFTKAVLVSALFAAALALLLAAGIGVVASRYLIRPLGVLVEGTRRLARGDFSHRVDAHSQDELGVLSDAFNDMAEKLQQQEQVRKNLLADVAHELRTPLAVLQANFEALQDDAAPATPETLLPMHDEVLRMARLVSDLQELSLAEAGRLPLHRTPVEFARVVEQVIQALEPEAGARGVSLTADFAHDLPPLEADRDRLTQVLVNLISNALRHTGSGGSVRVAGRTQAGEVVVSVTDTGEGIHPEDLPHVFDRFYRADTSRSRHSGGAGLGLAICKGFVEAHGGRIWAESAPGRGTAMSFAIPLTPTS